MRGADEDLAKYADMLGRRSLNNLVFDDDDFFDIHLREEAFLNLMKNYTFVLGFTGRRWYGQIKPWTPIEETGNDKFKEEGAFYWRDQIDLHLKRGLTPSERIPRILGEDIYRS